MNEKQLTGTDTAPALDAQELTAEHEAQELTTAQNAQELTEEPNAADRLDFNTAADRDIDSMTLEEIEQATAGAAGRIDGKLKIQAEDLKKSLMDMIAEKNPEALQTFISVTSAISEFLKSDQYQTIKKNIEIVRAYLEQHAEDIRTLSTAAMSFAALMPFVEAELKEAIKDNPDLQRYEECTLEELIADGFDEQGRPKQGPLFQIIERAQRRHDEFIEAGGTINQIIEAGGDLEKLGAAAAGLPRVTAKKVDRLSYPLDKPNSLIWDLVEDAVKKAPNGQVKLKIDTSKKGSEKEALILYAINFDELPAGVEITKKLTQFDKRVYIAAAALFNDGNKPFTATQVYAAMGNKGKPRTSDIRKIDDSLTKMGAARVYINNELEVQTNKGYKKFVYDAPLLPFERMKAYINGQFTDSAIHLFREPPLITFAKERKQITTIPRNLLESPINKTDANLKLDDYLIERTGHMKNPKSKAPRKILFSKIYEQCGISTAMQKQRAPEKIRRYLDHYKECGWIAGYKEETDGITIIL